MGRFHTDKAIYVLHDEAGGEVAGELCSALGAVQVSLSNDAAAVFESCCEEAGAFVFVGPLMDAVRSLAGLLKDEAANPAVVAVSSDGGFAVPVLVGNNGLAGSLALECAGILSSRGALYVPTASGDRTGFTAPGLWASRRGYHILLRGRLAAVTDKLNSEGGISVWVDPIISERGICFPLPFGYRPVSKQDDADVIISPRAIQKLAGAKPQIVPRMIVAGIGCTARTSADTIHRVVKNALSNNGNGSFLFEAITEIRPVDAKRWGPGIARFADIHKLPVSVIANTAGELLGPMVSEARVTVALSMTKPGESGSLRVIGTGPGNAKYVTMEARAAIDASEIVMGYKLYVDLIPEAWTRGKIVERYGMGEEEDRVRRAFSYAVSGYRVALLSGGDASLFGLAPLCMSMLPDSIGLDRVRIVPGLTAAQAAGTAIGAPYTNGLVLLSLSDYLQPWDDIVSAMEGAVETGAAVALYNPVEKGLAEKLSEVGRIFGGRRAVIIRDAGRPEESAAEKPARDITPDDLDMRTMIFILSPKARERSIGGRKAWIEANAGGSEAETPGSPEKPEIPAKAPEDATIVRDAETAIDLAVKQTAGDDVVLIATGAKDLEKVMPRLRKEGRGILARVPPTVRSMTRAERLGLSAMEIIGSCDSGGGESNTVLYRRRNVRCIVSSESDAEGQIAEFAAAANELGIPLILIARADYEKYPYYDEIITRSPH